VWRAAVGQPDATAHLAREGAERLRELIAVVDAEARPWQEATGLAAEA
jgi:hypothetical protein